MLSLEHFPKYVGGSVTIADCRKLKSLMGCLKILENEINLSVCDGLDSLKYGPEKVMTFYDCTYCKLKSLYGAPNYIGDWFDCSNNELSSLKYSPRHIGDDFIFKNNNIYSFDCFPDYVGGEIDCSYNPVYEVYKLFKNKEYIDYFNQMKIIGEDGKKINIKRLNVFLKSIGKESVENVEGYENI